MSNLRNRITEWLIKEAAVAVILAIGAAVVVDLIMHPSVPSQVSGLPIIAACHPTVIDVASSNHIRFSRSLNDAVLHCK